MLSPPKTVRGLLAVVSLALLPNVACLPGGGGGGGGGAFPANNQNSPQTGPTTISLVPPASLTLDGQDVNAGQFVVEEATAFSFRGSMDETTVVSGSPVVIDATIGQGEHELFDVPGDSQAIEVTGYFDATDPDLERANFNVTIFGDFSEPIEFTVFLPASTSDETNQITGTTREGDETTIFTDMEIPSEAYSAVAEEAGDDPGNIDTEASPLNVAPSMTSVVEHGRARAAPSVAMANNTQGADCASLCTDPNSCNTIQRLCNVYQSENCSQFRDSPTCVDDFAQQVCPEQESSLNDPMLQQCLSFIEGYDFEPDPNQCTITEPNSPCGAGI